VRSNYNLTGLWWGFISDIVDKQNLNLQCISFINDNVHFCSFPTKKELININKYKFNLSNTPWNKSFPTTCKYKNRHFNLFKVRQINNKSGCDNHYFNRLISVIVSWLRTVCPNMRNLLQFLLHLSLRFLFWQDIQLHCFLFHYLLTYKQSSNMINNSVKRCFM